MKACFRSDGRKGLAAGGMFIALLALSFLLPAAAAETPRQIRASFYPYGRIHEMSPDGRRSGLGFEVFELIAKKAGWTNRYIGTDRSWAESERMIETGELDVLDCVRKLPGREKRYEFSALPMGFSFCLVVVRTNETRFASGRYAAWGRPKVGAMKNEAVAEEFAFHASTHGLEYERRTYPSAAASLAALRAGEIDMAVMESMMCTTGFRVLESINPRPYYLCTKKGNRALMDEIDRAMADIYEEDPGWYHEICRRYYPREDIVVYLPHVHRGGGTRQRYLRAMADLLAAIGGWNPIFRECAADFSDADFSVPSIAAGLYRTPENLERFDFPFLPACRRPVCLYGRRKERKGEKAKGAVFPQVPRDRTYTIGYVENETAWRKCFLDYASSHNLAYSLTPIASVQDARDAVRTGKVDLALLGRGADDPEGLVRVEDCGSVDSDFATPRSQPALRRMLDMSVRYMRYHERVFIRQIERYAYGVEDESRVVRAGVYPEFGALDIAADGTVSGYIADYLREVAKTAGWDLVFVPMTYGEAFEALADGDVDIVGFSTPYPEVSDRWDTSRRDAGVVRYALKVKVDSPLLANRPDLWKGDRIGYLAGSRPIAELKHHLDSLGAKYRLVPYTSIRDARADIEGGRLEGIFTVHARESKNYRTIAVFPLVHTLFCTNRRRPEVKAQLDRAMDSFAAQNMDFNWWLNNHYLRTSRELLTMDADEVAFVGKNRSREFVINCPRNLPPVASWDEKTKTAGGFLAELFRRIGRELGLRFRLTGGRNDERADVYVIDREINALRDGMIVDQDWFPIPTVKVSLPEDRIPAAARGIWAVERQRRSEIEYLRRNNREPLLADTKEECYRAVAEGRAEATIDNLGTARLMIDEHRAFRKLRDTRIDSREWARQVSIAYPADGSPELRRLFRKARTSISDATAEQLFLDAIIAARRGRFSAEDITLYSVIIAALIVVFVAAAAVWFVRKQLRQELLEKTNSRLNAANRHAHLRADALDFILHHENMEGFIDFFSSRILDIYGCDQVIFRDIEGRMIIKEKPGTPQLDFSLCQNCPHFAFDAPVYRDGFTLMDDCTVGYNGIPVHRDCRVKASLTYLVHEETKVFGYIALHYLDRTHHFTEDERSTFNSVAQLLSLVITRRKHRAIEAENARRIEVSGRHEKLKAEAFEYVLRNEDFDAFLEFFSNQVIRLYGCDHVLYRDAEGRQYLKERPGAPSISFGQCPDCPHHDFNHPVYADGFTVMEDCRVGAKGIPVHSACPVRSALTYVVYEEKRPFGYIAIHYLDGIHVFTEEEKNTFDRVSKFLSMVISRRKQQRDIETARRAAEDASQAKTQFLFNMSHDVRTPLNAIRGFTEMAKKSPERVGDCLDKIERSGELLLTLLNSVLDMSRIESGRAALQEQEGDVLQSFVNVETPLRELAKDRGVDLSFAFGDIPDRYVWADHEKTSRVFMNIISNAIKYSRPNGWVKVSCEQEGALGDRPLPCPPGSDPRADRVAIYRYTFEDNGIGMGEEFQKHVFDLFARERNSTTSRIEGSGLGLALCKSFVELMGGTIECRSKKGEGTTFVVELPFRVRGQVTGNGEQVDGAACADDAAAAGSRVPRDRGGNDDGGTGESGHAGRATPPSFAGRRVLLVEDNELNREVAEFVLKDQGFDVESAEDGSVAVGLVGEKGLEYYDLILMDIQMPVMNGYEATKAIRALGFRRPVIALSANAFAEDRSASLAAGMDDHVAKPIKVKELMAALAAFGGKAK